MASASSMGSPDESPATAPSLRDAQRELTRQRIVAALAELISDEHPFEVSMAAVAARAGVSEPTLYRHFPTKKDLFAALATMQFRHVVAGIDPRSVGEIGEAVHTVFHRAAAMAPVVRWTLAAPEQPMPRPNAAARLQMLRAALADTLTEQSPEDADHLLRAVLLLTSPMAWLYWNDYLGLDPDQAADTAAWLIHRITRP